MEESNEAARVKSLVQPREAFLNPFVIGINPIRDEISRSIKVFLFIKDLNVFLCKNFSTSQEANKLQLNQVSSHYFFLSYITCVAIK